MQINYDKAWKLISEWDNIHILTHKNPDGDTLGSAFSLVNLLRKIGKKANVYCHDGFPQRYQFMYEGYAEQNFVCEHIISVDLADEGILGDNLSSYKGRIELSIDHHISNTGYAQYTLLNASASSACEVLFRLYTDNKQELNKIIATCLYTGMATDTGCFRYANTTRECHRAAASLMDYDVEFALINRKMFEIKSKARIKVEQYLMTNLEYYFGDKVSLIAITRDVIDNSHIEEAEFDGLASLTLQTEGVEVGVTIKQKDTNAFKVSMRSADYVDVSSICQQFGGGGHVKAAGCLINGELSEVKQKLLNAIEKVLEEK